MGKLVKGTDYVTINDKDGFPLDVVMLPSSAYYDLFTTADVYDDING